MNKSLGTVARFPDEHKYQQNQGNTVLSFFGCAEATTGFVLKDIIYSGRESDSVPHRNLATDILMKLCSIYFGTGRDIYVNRYFASHVLVCNLLQ